VRYTKEAIFTKSEHSYVLTSFIYLPTILAHVMVLCMQHPSIIFLWNQA